MLTDSTDGQPGDFYLKTACINHGGINNIVFTSADNNVASFSVPATTFPKYLSPNDQPHYLVVEAWDANVGKDKMIGGGGLINLHQIYRQLVEMKLEAEKEKSKKESNSRATSRTRSSSNYQESEVDGDLEKHVDKNF